MLKTSFKIKSSCKNMNSIRETRKTSLRRLEILFVGSISYNDILFSFYFIINKRILKRFFKRTQNISFVMIFCAIFIWETLRLYVYIYIYAWMIVHLYWEVLEQPYIVLLTSKHIYNKYSHIIQLSTRSFYRPSNWWLITFALFAGCGVGIYARRDVGQRAQ